MSVAVYNGNTWARACGRRTRQSPRRRCAAHRDLHDSRDAMDWGIRRKLLRNNFFYFESVKERRFVPPLGWNGGTNDATESGDRPLIVNKRMWPCRVVEPVCPQMPVGRPVPVFLTRSTVRCPFVRGINI